MMPLLAPGVAYTQSTHAADSDIMRREPKEPSTEILLRITLSLNLKCQFQVWLGGK